MTSKNWNEFKKEIKITDEEMAEIELWKNIIKLITQKRIALGMTQRELAEKTGLKQSAISRLEKFNSPPKIETLLKITSSLHLTIKIEEDKSQKSNRRKTIKSIPLHI